ncbi:RHS repeat-associated core domain-containing protein [Brevundimonas pondensis]|uniref:RHS repeat domain-containing protein n=1 Tax=Brevundimonas pondensis TaxID=2774189 RepID=UPI0032097D21
MKTALKLALLASSALFASSAWAQQQPTPPEHYTLDARGVDLVTGDFAYQANDVVIGQPGQGGLVHSRVYANGGWRDTLSGTIGISGSLYTVSLGARSELFVKSGSAFVPVTNRGATLSQSGDQLTYRMSDGTVATYSTAYSGWAAMYSNQSAALVEVRRLNGEQQTYHWDSTTYCSRWEIHIDPDSPAACLQYSNASRLEAVSNNYGYRINFEYALNEAPETSEALNNSWFKRIGATGVNLAAPDGLGMQSVSYEVGEFGGPPVASSNQAGTTTYTHAGRLTGVRLPGSTADDLAIAYVGGKVSRVTDATGIWDYVYADNGTTRTTTIAGPMNQQLVVVSDQTIGRATSVTDGLNRTVGYQYDAQKRLERIVQPEGDYSELTYDGRGNVTQTLSVPKPGSGQASITTSAAYPATCANVITCNLPASTTDARGYKTDYTYDPAHGGVLTVTQPAPSAGAVRPQTRITYAAQTAQYRNAAGVLAPAPSTVILPVSASACATGASCAGTADEVKTSITYGAPGVASNLLPTVVATGAGDGSLTAVTTMTYTASGDIAAVDGPLPGSGDTVIYRYDHARRPIGVIGPDPDGGGPLLRRAQRATYDDRGLVVLAEQGVVNGLSDGDWAAFSSLQQASTTYDANRRPTHQRQLAGGVVHSVQQVSYDIAGRVDCAAVRMNPSVFAALPASACDAGAIGAFGPDRISRNNYDAAGQLIATTSGYGVDPIVESATYTANGQPQTLTDGNGNVSTIEYDGFGRALKMFYPNASGGGSSSTDYEQYWYDAGGNVTSFRNRGGDLIHSGYDALNRVAMSGATISDRSFAYDNLGRLTSAVLTGGSASLTRSWDALGRMSSETQNPLGKTVGYQYDLAGRQTGLAWPDGFYVNYDYNLAGDLTAIRENGATNWELTSWAYDNLGRRIAQARANGATTAWTYDAAGRLGGLAHDLPGTADDQNLTFTYNPAGQIVSRTLSNTAYAYTPGLGATAYANNGKNQVTSVGGAAIAYDGRQNITGAPMGTYAYDGLNQMTSATVGGATTGFAYDAAGRMIQMGATRLLHDGARPMAEYDTAGNLLRRYVPGLGMDETVAAYEGAGLTDRRWLLTDERHSVTAYTNGSAAVLARNTYDEYGQPSSGNVGLFQYTGQIWLPQAQAYHYKARAYAPQLGRFMQADPIGYQAGANLYGYVKMDPINLRDPRGLSSCRTPDYWRVWSYSNSGPTWTEGQEIRRELVWKDAECSAGSGESGPGGGGGGGDGGFAGGPSPWNIAFRNSFRGRSQPIRCEASRKVQGIETATDIGGRAHGALATIVESVAGNDAALPFKPLSWALDAFNVEAKVILGVQRGQSEDVILVNTALPFVGGLVGARLGSGAGIIGIIPGGLAGDRLLGSVADSYTSLRGQYCP